MLKKIMFVEYGDEGHNVWKCLNCKSSLDAGYPRCNYIEGKDDPEIIGSSYTFCPHCGIRFEGVHANSKMNADRPTPFNTKYSMENRYRILKCLANNRRE